MPALTYRNFRASDFEAMHAMVSHWEVVRNLGAWPWPPDPDFTRSRCRPFEGNGFAWAICENEELVGSISLTDDELGYMLRPEYHGRGIIQTAARQVLAFGFADPAREYVRALAWADNAISIHILEKLGFVLESETYDHAKARNAQTHSKTFHLTRAAWGAVNDGAHA